MAVAAARANTACFESVPDEATLFAFPNRHGERHPAAMWTLPPQTPRTAPMKPRQKGKNSAAAGRDQCQPKRNDTGHEQSQDAGGQGYPKEDASQLGGNKVHAVRFYFASTGASASALHCSQPRTNTLTFG